MHNVSLTSKNDSSIVKNISEIKLYGTESCHKSVYYKEILSATYFPYKFLDVKRNETDAEALRSLYENRKLNFPTITIGSKRLRNPSKEVLEKWLQKSIK